MKQIIFILTLVTAGIANAQSSYEILLPIRKVLSADISFVRNLSQPHLLPEIGVSGELIIDKRLKKVVLNVRQQTERDPAFHKNVYQTTLTLLNITKDVVCGTVTYIAGTDPRAYSRTLETLTIVDNSKNICETFRKLEPTEARLEHIVNGTAGGPTTQISVVDLAFSKLTIQSIE